MIESPDRPEFAPDPGYRPILPSRPRPIVIIGAGGIVRDAHLPAYRKAGYPVAGIVDVAIDRARDLADRYRIDRTHGSVTEAVAAAPDDVIFDCAVMPEHYVQVLSALPDGAAVLLQKPIGNNWSDTLAIMDVIRSKGLIAAVNTQLRFAPYVTVAREAIARGEIGELYDLEVVVEVNTPWEYFPAVLGLDRLELNMHSIHHLDLIRSFVGDPESVSCSTVRHPTKQHANSRSAIVLHYDRPLRAIVCTNHDHRFGPDHEQSFIKWEGTDGAIRAQMGVLMDYPQGRADRLEINTGDGWRPLPFDGSWFPDAFMYSMGVLQRHLTGELRTLPTAVSDVFATMAVLEAGYTANDRGGVRPDYDACPDPGDY
ncbi:Gfo/Idh/MocA family protein [Microlunatus soli]|uniref:Predicted dehydrogenase n=1 Tax=Microlunatus soli TaxID=630515 RepID=A0A1H1ZSA1_9ACTN|nr:Gfo/Idh/MocA family oxidoreductase [Microlunatus soli]SDT36272.1 Predicted dehydrogenase [Microlunatus soli]